MCRLPGWRRYMRCVQVDILTPGGDLDLPEIPASATAEIENIPVMPLFDLLVTKTQGWWNHRVSLRKDFRAKVDADIGDVDALLDHAKEEGIDYEDERAISRHTYEFMEEALLLARRFIRKNLLC
jgi:hypothetical protein